MTLWRFFRIEFRNPSYFRGAPRAPSVVAREVPDINTDLVMLRAGQLDWSLLSPAQRLALGPDSKLKIGLLRDKYKFTLVLTVLSCLRFCPVLHIIRKHL